MDSIKYYQTNAEKYFDYTVNIDMSTIYEPFLELLVSGGHILDAGCGSGRDSLKFLKRKFKVTAFDASPELAAKASILTGLNIKVMNFREIQYREEFDGIWCCASLLHVPKKDLPHILNKLILALKNNGLCYLSFKYGEGEVIKDNRLFNNYTEESFDKFIEQYKELKIMKIWLTQDVRKDRDHEKWLNVILKRINY